MSIEQPLSLAANATKDSIRGRNYISMITTIIPEIRGTNTTFVVILQNTFNSYFESKLVNPKIVDIRDHCLALADKIYASACTLND